MQLLQSDSLSFVLDQEAFEQGYRPPYLLYEYLMHKKQPAHELLYTDIAIRTKYNSELFGVLHTHAEQSGVTGAEDENGRAWQNSPMWIFSSGFTIISNSGDGFQIHM